MVNGKAETEYGTACYLSSASSDREARITSSRLFSEMSPDPKPRPSSSRALRTRCTGAAGLGGAPTITAGRVMTTLLAGGPPRLATGWVAVRSGTRGTPDDGVGSL